MLAFFAKTWFLWWSFAVVVILRWFQVAAAANEQGESDLIPEPNQEPAPHPMVVLYLHALGLRPRNEM